MEDCEEYLISYANFKSGIFKFQNSFVNESQLKNFYKKPHLGVPVCLPSNIKYFDYTNAKYFKIDKKTFSKFIFSTSNLNYIGNKKYFRYGDIFASNVKLKKKYKKKVNFYLKNIKLSKQIIKAYKKKFKNICAMQIRNVPHFGHEAVFKHLINNFDLLVLNPIFGIKKKNDFTDNLISKALRFMQKKYKKIKFLPIYTNFHYAGPREAFHHMSIREKLGFKNFYIGRDHAGAENLYSPSEASKEVKKFKKKFIIRSFTSLGGYYCNYCEKYLIKGSCNHSKLINISGTDLRACLKSNKTYIHADRELQRIVSKFYD